MGVIVNPQVEAAISLRNSIESLIDDPLRGSVGSFVAADPSAVPGWLRPYQAAYRRACDIYSRAGAVGDLVGGIGLIYNPACGEYLGSDLPQFESGTPPFTGGQCSFNYTATVSGDFYSNGTFVFPVSTNAVIPGPISNYDVGPVTGVQGSNGSIVALDSSAYGGAPPKEFRNVVKSVVPVSGTDTCGDPPAPPPTYPPTVPGPPPSPTFDYIDDDDGRPINITIGDPSINVDGTISLPITVGDITLDLAGGTPGGTPQFTNEPSADFDNGSDPIRPGDDGQPEDGVDYSGPVSCALVVVTEEPANASQEIGGPEAVFISGYRSDAGWYRFVKELGTTEQHRITSRTTISCYCCETRVADGFQCKFSYGFDGYVIIYPPKEQG